MKTLLTTLATLLSLNLLALSGGPDAYGYTFLDSNEPGGPTYNWIDISTIGTPVTGLADDNSVAFIPMGMSFHYYWQDFTNVKIGSNGWIGFENTSNIAHCFPTIPMAGGAGDAYLAPFMTDLFFNGGMGIGDVYYYHDVVNEQFIISYEDVPWWSANAPGYVGSNSFQVILSNVDSSIVFQYQMSDVANFLDNGTCASDMVIGIEAPSGNIGLSAYQDVLPPSNYAIKFEYPSTVLIDIYDITAKYNVNPENKAEFHKMNVPLNIPINIANVGNADVSTDIVVNANVYNSVTLAVVGNYQTTIVGGLTQGMDSILNFLWTPTAPGQHHIETVITNATDINPGNNSMITELEIIDPAAGVQNYDYVNDTDLPTGSISWSTPSGDGVGLYIAPNDYPFVVNSIAAYVTGTAGDDLIMELYDDNGGNGAPGTLLYTETVPAANVVLNSWMTITLPTSVTINSGVYVAWIQSGSLLVLGTTTAAPMSRQGYEYLGSWATYRDNTSQELMLRLGGESVCASFSLSVDNVQQAGCFGENNGAIDLTVTGGVPTTNGYTYTWTNYSGSEEDIVNLAPNTYYITVTDSIGCSRSDSIVITENPELLLSATTVPEMNGMDGSIDLTVTGGTASYQFAWSNGAGNVEDLTGIAGGSYTVVVTDGAGCEDSLSIQVDSFVGLTDIDANQWSVYPNPSSGWVQIETSADFAGGTVTIADMLGKTVYHAAVTEQMKVELHEAGIYVVTLRSNEGVSTKKITIE